MYKSRIEELQTVYNTYADSNPDEAKKTDDVSIFTDYLTGTFVENIKTFYGKAECPVLITDFFDTRSWYTKCKADITIDTPDDARSSCLTGTGDTTATGAIDAAPNAAPNAAPGAAPGADAIAADAPTGDTPTGDAPTGANGNGALVIADATTSAAPVAPPAALGSDTTDAAAPGANGTGEGGGKNKTIKHRRKTNKYTMRNYLRNKTTIKKNRHRYHNNTIKK